jgi:DNA transformation protein
MTRIGAAVNVGPVLAGELRAAGVETLERLRELGYLEAWRRLRTVNPERDCVHSCLALAGAIEGQRWRTLPRERRERIAAEARASGG